MTNKIDGGPAFPFPVLNSQANSGMSLRDYYAGCALTAIAGSKSWATAEDAATEAFRCADAMIAARE